MRFAIYNAATGQISRVVTTPASYIEWQRAAGESYVPMPVGDDSTHYIADGELVPYPPRPSSKHIFDFTSGTWADPRGLAAIQSALLDAATARRWMVETGGIELQGGIRVGTEKADQDRVTSVIVNATAAGVESVDFKAKSGWVTLTVAQVRGIASAIARHVQACFTAERAHHEAIAALSSLEEARVYDVRAGWP